MLILYIRLDKEVDKLERRMLFFSDPMPRWMVDREKVYCQIGSLTNLWVLDLRVRAGHFRWNGSRYHRTSSGKGPFLEC